MLAFVPGLVLGATDPAAEGLAVGQAYDLRFGEDGLRIARSGSPEATAEYRYADVAAVQVTGFERVMTASRMDLLLSPGTRPDEFYEYRIHLRVQAGDRTLDFWRAVLPAKNYPWLEPVNRAIREAWLSAGAGRAERHTDRLVSELSRLADRLEHGTLTRSISIC